MHDARCKGTRGESGFFPRTCLSGCQCHCYNLLLVGYGVGTCQRSKGDSRGWGGWGRQLHDHQSDEAIATPHSPPFMGRIVRGESERVVMNGVQVANVLDGGDVVYDECRYLGRSQRHWRTILDIGFTVCCCADEASNLPTCLGALLFFFNVH